MRNKLVICLVLMFNISCSIYKTKTEKIYFFSDSSNLQPFIIKIKIPKQGLINRHEIFSTSHIDREVNYLYKDSSFFYINTNIPTLDHISEDKFGINEKNLFWRNFSNDKITIGYKNVEKGRRDEFDKIIESTIKKLVDL